MPCHAFVLRRGWVRQGRHSPISLTLSEFRMEKVINNPTQPNPTPRPPPPSAVSRGLLRVGDATVPRPRSILTETFTIGITSATSPQAQSSTVYTAWSCPCCPVSRCTAAGRTPGTKVITCPRRCDRNPLPGPVVCLFVVPVCFMVVLKTSTWYAFCVPHVTCLFFCCCAFRVFVPGVWQNSNNTLNSQTAIGILYEVPGYMIFDVFCVHELGVAL